MGEALTIVCPAGEPVGETVKGPGCRCRIERHTLTAGGEPVSLAAYCMAEETGRDGNGNSRGYTQCPTWRKHKEKLIWEARERTFMDFTADNESNLEAMSDAKSMMSR